MERHSPTLHRQKQGGDNGKQEIERVLLLLQKRFNELSDIKDVVTAEEVRNVFQGLAETQDTIMKLYVEHNSDYACV